MRISIRCRVNVDYQTGGSINVPDTFTEDEIKAKVAEWVEENYPECGENWHHKVVGT